MKRNQLGRMRYSLITFLAVMFLIEMPAILCAHPMGNFSINHYAGFSASSSALQIHYIIDMAEIPTFQEMKSIDVDQDRVISDSEAAAFAAERSREFGNKLTLSLNGKAARLTLVSSGARIMPGAGGLPTIVLSATFETDWRNLRDVNSIEYMDHNFSDRLGWKEIAVDEQTSALFGESSSGYKDRSRKLTQYPADPMLSPPQEVAAAFSFTQARLASLEDHATTQRKTFAASWIPRAGKMRDDGLTRLITSRQFNIKILLASFVIAFVLGAMHALSPGHGKTIVAGYLIGSKGTAFHALLLGAVVTFTHTIGVFFLGLITLYGSRYVLPERLYPWLGFISGVSIVVIGLTTFRSRYRAAMNRRAAHIHDHKHSHGHHHHHDDVPEHGHSHLPVDSSTGEITWKSLLTIGISGGALPCPSALVVLLSAISIHRIAYGLLLIVAFSLGLALVLTSIGLMLVYTSKLTHRIRADHSFVTHMPLVSSVVISVLGFAIAIRSLM